MIKLSNGHEFNFVAQSGSMAYGTGWAWDKALELLKVEDLSLFTIITKTLTPQKWEGNFKWRNPFGVIKFLTEDGKTIHPLLAFVVRGRVAGLVNAFGLTNHGFGNWLACDYPAIVKNNRKVIVSFTCDTIEQGKTIVRKLSNLENVVGVEFNPSCPNKDSELLKDPKAPVIFAKEIASEAPHLPLIIKLGYTQPYLEIAKQLKGYVEAININSVPWNIVFPNKLSPLVKYGGGGVSGKLAQPFTFQMVEDLSKGTNVPIIGTSIWEYKNLNELSKLGASAFGIGSFKLPYPRRSKEYILKWREENTYML